MVDDSPGRTYAATGLRGAHAAFERPGLQLAFAAEPALHGRRGRDPSPEPPSPEQVIARIRARVAGPAHTAALTTCSPASPTADWPICRAAPLPRTP